jgi:hypothetical protein
MCNTVLYMCIIMDMIKRQNVNSNISICAAGADAVVELALELARDLANELGALGKRNQYLGELACLGIFAKIPNAAKHPQLGQVTPSHAK